MSLTAPSHPCPVQHSTDILTLWHYSSLSMTGRKEISKHQGQESFHFFFSKKTSFKLYLLYSFLLETNTISLMLTEEWPWASPNHKHLLKQPDLGESLGGGGRKASPSWPDSLPRQWHQGEPLEPGRERLVEAVLVATGRFTWRQACSCGISPSAGEGIRSWSWSFSAWEWVCSS